MMKNLKREIEALRKDCLLATQIEYKKDNPILTSMTGGTFWGEKDETWPYFDSKPLVPILSILTSDLPNKINHFDNIRLINVFAYEDGAPIDEQEGSVVIRTYSDLKNLKPLLKPESMIKPCFKIKWKKATDYPNGYQLEQSLNEEDYKLYLDNNEQLTEKFPNHSGIKIGGWPYLVQEIHFLKFDCPEYVFQFDSNEVFMFCDCGVGIFMKSDKIGWNSCWDTF
jgi:hypothetical protein